MVARVPLSSVPLPPFAKGAGARITPSALFQFHRPSAPSKNNQAVLLIKNLLGAEDFPLIYEQNAWAHPPVAI